MGDLYHDGRVVGGNSSIDDSDVDLHKTWSSEKINTEIVKNSYFNDGDSITLGGYHIFAGRLGWSRSRVVFSIPLPKLMRTTPNISFNKPIVIYPGDDKSNSCTVTNIININISANILTIMCVITPASAWTNISDSIANVEFNTGDTITISF